MKRLLGSRRVAMLLASALPLLAEEPLVEQQQSEHDAVASLMDPADDYWTDTTDIPENHDATAAAAVRHVEEVDTQNEAEHDAPEEEEEATIRIRKPLSQESYEELMGHSPHKSFAASSEETRTRPKRQWRAEWTVDDDDSVFPFFAFEDNNDCDLFVPTEEGMGYHQWSTATTATIDFTNVTTSPEEEDDGECIHETNHVLFGGDEPLQLCQRPPLLPLVNETESCCEMESESESVLPAKDENEATIVEGETDLEEEEDSEEPALQQSNATESLDEISALESAANETNATESQQQQQPPDTTTTTTTTTETEETAVKHVSVDYASKAAGALILASSKNFQGASNLLQKDNDRYAIVPCEEESKYVVIGLSEDILVKQVVLSNFERYSSHMKEIHLSGSATAAMGSKDWIDLGTYITTPVSSGSRAQTFDLTEPTWARYLKFEFLSHYGDEYYCTVSQISVHGSTMVQGFHEQWAELESEDDADDSEPSDSEESSEDANGEPVEASGDEEATEMDSVEGATDTNDASLNDHGFTRRFPPALSQCFSHSGLSCPGGKDFERRMMSFLSGNASDYDEEDTLSSASVCLSSSHPVTSNESFLETSHLRWKHWSSEIKSDGKQRRLDLLSSLSNDEGFGHGVISDRLDKKASPVVERIKGIIRHTAVNVEGLGNSLLRSLPAQDEEGETSTEFPQTKDVVKESRVVVKEKQETQQPKPTVPSTEVEEESEIEPQHDINHSLARALGRLPSSKCLEKLDFAGFKKEFLSTRNKGNGQPGNNHPTGVPMEPIFKKLTDEIKSLQGNVAVHDQFAKESILCYQSVLLEILVEMESLRTLQDARISKLESNFYLGPVLIALYRLLTGSLLWLCHPAVLILSVLIGEDMGHQFSPLVISAIAGAVGLLALSFLRRKKIQVDSSKLPLVRTPRKELEIPATPKKEDEQAPVQNNDGAVSVAAISPEEAKGTKEKCSSPKSSTENLSNLANKF